MRTELETFLQALAICRFALFQLNYANIFEKFKLFTDDLEPSFQVV